MAGFRERNGFHMYGGPSKTNATGAPSRPAAAVVPVLPRYDRPMLSAADPTAVAWIDLVAIVVFAGFTASLLCVVLERRLVGARPTGRSRCACGAPIPMIRNVPVVSWLLQHGKADCCGAHIPTWYVLAEATFVVASVVGAVAAWPHVLIGGAVATAVSSVGLTLVWHQRQRRI